MYATIRSVDGDKRFSHRGKNPWVNTDDFELSVGKPPAEHLGNPDKFLRLTAGMNDFIGTGRYIWRELQIELCEEDIRKILRFALSHDLIGIKVGLTKGKKRKRPKQRQLKVG